MGLLITVPYSSITVWFILAGRFGKVSEKKLYTRVPLHKNRMQLPVGNILEIKTSERISSILNSIKHTKFSGICHISSNTVSGTLVFESGECILAQIGDKSGNEALEDLLKISHYNVDAAFLDMDEAQVQRALGFNKVYRIIKSADPTHFTAHDSQRPASPTDETTQIPIHQLPELEKFQKTEDLTQDLGSFEKDIDTFDTLDIELVTDKIRRDCKTIIKQLDLEHLMEQ